MFEKLLVLRWNGWRRLARDFFIIQVGFLLFGISIDVMVQANIGVSSWTVLAQGLTYHLPISLGQASIYISVVIVIIDVLLREKLGWGTISNALFVGLWVDLARPFVPAAPQNLAIQIAYLLLGTLVMGFATAIYVGVNVGAGPRDSLMLAVARILGASVRVARTIIEIIVVFAGWLLGGPVWIGTLISAIAIGPAVQMAFRVLRIDPSRRFESEPCGAVNPR